MRIVKKRNKDKPETNENLESKRMKLLFAYLFIQFSLLNHVNVLHIKSIKILKANPDKKIKKIKKNYPSIPELKRSICYLFILYTLNIISISVK